MGARGLFGGARPKSPDMAGALASVMPVRPDPMAQAFPAQRGYGIADRIHDFAATYNGEPTRRSQLDARRDADAFGSTFGSLAGDTNPMARDQNYAQMQRLIAARAARGEDVAAFNGMAGSYRDDGNRDALASSLPPELQAAGRYAPQSGAAYQFDQNSQNIYPGVDGDYVRGAKGAGQFQSAYDGPLATPNGYMPDPSVPGGLAARPGGPEDPKYLYNRQYQATRGIQEATPDAPLPMPTESNVVAMVMQKAMRGEQLNPQEQAILDRQTAIPQAGGFNPFMMMGGMPGGMAPGVSPYSGQPQQGQAPQQQGDPYPGIAEGQVVVQDGVRYQRRNGQMVPAN